MVVAEPVSNHVGLGQNEGEEDPVCEEAQLRRAICSVPAPDQPMHRALCDAVVHAADNKEGGGVRTEKKSVNLTELYT
jgi:hypothetical protein